MAHWTWPESQTLLIWCVPVCVCLSAVGHWLSRAQGTDNEEAPLLFKVPDMTCAVCHDPLPDYLSGVALWNVGKRVSESRV